MPCSNRAWTCPIGWTGFRERQAEMNRVCAELKRRDRSGGGEPLVELPQPLVRFLRDCHKMVVRAYPRP
jgi:hypothetical protein